MDPPKMLVARGLYQVVRNHQVVRNPMYAGVVLILLGESILFASRSILEYALIAWLLFALFVIVGVDGVMGYATAACETFDSTQTTAPEPFTVDVIPG
jgi:hypothetical protein